MLFDPFFVDFDAFTEFINLWLHVLQFFVGKAKEQAMNQLMEAKSG